MFSHNYVVRRNYFTEINNFLLVYGFILVMNLTHIRLDRWVKEAHHVGEEGTDHEAQEHRDGHRLDPVPDAEAKKNSR